MRTGTDKVTQPRRRGKSLDFAASLLLAAVMIQPLYARGTPEESWKEAAGNEVWRHEFDLTGAKPGTHNIIIRARDAAGNEALEGPYNIRIDPSAGLPAARIVYPEKDTVLRRDVHIIGVAGGRLGVGRVELKLDGGEYRAAEGTEYWSALIDGSSISDGRHTVTAKALDPRGGAGKETSVSFILDRQPPTVEITSHDSGALISGNVEMTGRADDANGIAKIELSADGGETFRELKLRSTKGKTEVTFSFPVQSRRIEDGPTIYRIRATDGTGAASVTPLLFFVDNQPPQLEILSPQEDALVCGAFRVTGTMRDVVGVRSLAVEFNKQTRDIEVRPGDPYWTADLNLTPGMGRTVEAVFTAVDRSGNRTVVKRRFRNNMAAASPTVELLFPGEAVLAAFPPDGAVFGRVAGGLGVETIRVEGGKTYPAKPGFRIPTFDIGQGRTDLRIQALNADGSAGEALRVRVARPPVPPPPAPLPDPSRIIVETPAAYGYFRDSIPLSGHVEDADGGRLEYRLGPGEPWREIPLGAGGAFSVTAALDGMSDGPVHLELRTVSSWGAENYPLYHPVNKHGTPPEILIASPRQGDEVNGSITVSGLVSSAAPVAEIFYTLDGKTRTPLEKVPCFAGAFFSFLTDFTALAKAKGSLVIHAVDGAGNTATVKPEVRVDSRGDLPTVQLHLPADGDVITGDFVISGMAFDDDGVAAVHYRIDKGEYRKVAAEQSFRIEVPLSEVRSGERRIEVYGEDIYGLTGTPVSAAIRVSTDSPSIELKEPDFRAHNRGSIFLRGAAKDSNGIAEIKISLDNGNSFQLAEGRESWSLPLNTAAYRDGVYSVLVVGKDNFGVESRISSLISIDNSPPRVSIGEPADGRATGPSLRISGQLADNTRVESLSFELSPVEGAGKGLKVKMEPRDVILETIDISSLPSGKYNLRMIATDGAGNSSVVVRSLELAKESSATRVVLFNPMPGIDHSGPLMVTGQVTGPAVPEKVTIHPGNGTPVEAPVDRFGFFHHPMEEGAGDGRVDFSAEFIAPPGETVRSLAHPVHMKPFGPVLTVDSHRTGESVRGRPWLRGRAWMELSPEEQAAAGKKADRLFEVSRVLLSLDNGRSFQPARGGKEWKFRLESTELPQGLLPVLVRAEFADGRSTTERIALTVDNAPPAVVLAAPQEGSLHSESLLMYGTAGDDHGLESIEVNLREGDKSGYGVPRFIQGLYLDSHFLGATFADFGAGVSFFDDTVKLQFQAGAAPPGRFTGNVFGAKLLANILLLPFDYFFGPDWSFFSMAFAVGANFSYFTMDGDNDPLVMSAVLLQWEFARFRISGWKAFRTFSLYVEPNLWFASSDVEAGAIFKVALGARVGIF